MRDYGEAGWWADGGFGDGDVGRHTTKQGWATASWTTASSMVAILRIGSGVTEGARVLAGASWRSHQHAGKRGSRALEARLEGLRREERIAGVEVRPFR